MKVEGTAVANPVSWDLAPGVDDLNQIHAGLQSAGVRMYPFPFGSALALTSDIDRSRTRHYRKYTDQIVKKHGLDFGDSVWLQVVKRGGFSGLGFLSWNYSYWTRKTHGYSSEFDHHDLANEYHLGNIDHWHCFLGWGPRITVLDFQSDEDGHLITRLPPRKSQDHDSDYGVRYLQVAAIGLVHDRTASPEVEKVVLSGKTLSGKKEWIFSSDNFSQCSRITGHTGQTSDKYAVKFIPLAGGKYDDRSLPWLENLTRIRIYLRQGKPASVRKIIVYNTYADVLFDRVCDLQDRLGIRMNLLTIHGKWMIPHYKQHERQRKIFSNRILEKPKRLGSIFGSGEVDGLGFSTNADEEQSFVRLYPELLNDCGICFWRPTGNGDTLRNISTPEKTGYVSITNLVTPSLRRDAGYIYLLTSTKARVRKKTGKPAYDKKTTARNFVERCGVILDDFREQQGRAAVMYTHLGNLTPLDFPSVPYFDKLLFRRLRRLCHGINYKEDAGPRLWFTRASVISDYALLLRQIAEHVERPDANTVVVKRWEDPYLKLELPRDKNQMYGLTFYVEDAGRAKVYLEGEAIEELVRNPADETGRESVTVAASGIGRVVLGGLDPALTSNLVMPVVGKRGVHEYHDNDGRFLRVKASPADCLSNFLRHTKTNLYGIGIKKSGLRTDGAQFLRIVCRRGSLTSQIGFLLRTVCGGRFFFGDKTLLAMAGNANASYTNIFTSVGTNQWSTLLIPFYALNWHLHDEIDPLKVALPANALTGIDILIAGDEDASIDVSEIVFTRPRTVGARGEKRIVIGGRVKGAEKGTEVRLKRIDGLEEYATQVETDDLGGFVFSQMSPGGYEVQVNGNPPVVVECLYDRYDLRLRQ